jgi:hypothetical protein
MAQLEQLTLTAQGLFTYSNTFSTDTAPDGSMAVASNVVIDKDGIVSPRRGYEQLTTSIPGTARLSSLTVYQEKTIAHDSVNNSLYCLDNVNTSASPSLLWTLSNLAKPLDAVSTKFAQASKSLFFTTNQGVQKIDKTSGTPIAKDAGVPPAVGFETQLQSGLGTAVQGRATTAFSKTFAPVTSPTTSINSVAHGFIIGDVVQLTTTGTLPAGLVTGVDYYVTTGSTADIVKLALTANGAAINMTTNGTGTGTITRMDVAYQRVNYRVLWGTKDANDNLVLGAPSDSQSVTNTDALAKDVRLKVYIPKRITETSYFCRVYRTVNNGISYALVGSLDDDAGDEMALCVEVALTQPMLDLGYIDFPYCYDITPDSLLGAKLYTNATQEGITAANYQPPQCVDLAFYQNHMFYGNTQRPFNYTTTLISVQAGSGLEVGDTITLHYGSTDIVYTAVASSPGLGQFVVSADANPFVAVEDTAKNLIQAINKDTRGAPGVQPAAAFYALYDVGPNDPPGRIKILETDFGLATNFTLKITYTDPARSAGSFNPPLQNNVAYNSVNESYPNRIYFSKLQEPEAVPSLNYFDIGSTNDIIKRLIPLKNQLVVMTDRAIYAVVGSDANSFQPVLLDNTTRLLAPDSAVSLSNQVYALFDQGVGRISSKTVEIVSRPIEGELLRIRGEIEADIETLTFGVPYESDRKYMLFLRDSSEAPAGKANLVYVFNTATITWTTYDLSGTAGQVSTNDKFVLADSARLLRERKNFNDLDITGEDFTFSSSGMTITGDAIFTGTPTLNSGWPRVGDMLYTNTSVGTKTFAAAAVNIATNEVTVTAHGYSNDDIVTLLGSNTVPGGLVYNNSYFVQVVDANTIRFALLPGQLPAAAVDLTSTGTGTFNLVFGAGGFKYTKVLSVALETDVTTQYVIRTQDALDYTAAANFPLINGRRTINIEVEYNPISAGHPGILKQWSEAMIITRQSMENFEWAFKSGNSLNFDTVPFYGQATGAWGLFGWGEVPWGGEQSTLRYRTYVPRDKQRDPSISIRIKQATSGNNFEIAGLQLMYRNVSSKVVR